MIFLLHVCIYIFISILGIDIDISYMTKVVYTLFKTYNHTTNPYNPSMVYLPCIYYININHQPFMQVNIYHTFGPWPNPTHFRVFKGFFVQRLWPYISPLGRPFSPIFLRFPRRRREFSTSVSELWNAVRQGRNPPNVDRQVSFCWGIVLFF